jgi:hypothetical protein
MAKKKNPASETTSQPPAAAARRRSSAADRVSRPNGDARRDPTHDEIAEAAYHRYLSRQGGGGSDFDDWLEAERDLRSRSVSNPESR